MSDIGIKISWFDLVLYSPFFGWPGLILGGLIGVLLWRKRPWLEQYPIYWNRLRRSEIG